jgi:hypothetical protein
MEGALHVDGNKIMDTKGNIVILKGIGRAGDVESASGMWGGQGGFLASWGLKWLDVNQSIPIMDATFQCYKEVWKVNMIRVFITVDWYWQDNVTPSVEDPENYPYWNAPISYQNYIETVVSEAAKYGLYVDLCPYQLVSFYRDSNRGGAQGLPMCWWDNASIDFLTDTGLKDEQTFWSQFWTLLATNLKDYPNVIYEAWNEPQLTGNEPIPPPYLTYLQTMYNSVHTVTDQNLLFLQWNAGYIPYYNDLSWCKQIADAIPKSKNIVYTTHAYRHSPSFNPQWETTPDMVLAQIKNAQDSMQVKAPLLINEVGCCMLYVSEDDKQSELDWCSSLTSAAKTLGIGLTAYYWVSDDDLGPVYSGMALLSGIWVNGTASPAPNQVGQIFLNYLTS